MNPVAETALQRTRLAWRRTTLSAAIAGLLLLAGVLPGSSIVAAAAVGLVVTLSWFALLLIAYRRIRTVSVGSATTLTRSPAAVGLLVAGFALIGCAVVLTQG